MNNNSTHKMIDELSEFINNVKSSENNDTLFEVPYMIKYQLADEISSAYDAFDEISLEGISN